jgi:hypothetical protein
VLSTWAGLKFLARKPVFIDVLHDPKFLIAKRQKKKKGNKIDNIDQNNNTRAFRSV